jgi:hypothetical protein
VVEEAEVGDLPCFQLALHLEAVVEEAEVGDLPCFQLALHLVAVVEEAEVEVHFSTAVEALAQVVAEAIQFLP